MRKTFTCAVSMMICVLLLTSSVSAATISTERTTITSRSEALFEAYIESSSGKDDISIQAIKYANDFAGNQYTVIECSPTGYYIFHDDSGVFVESSTESKSPYSGYDCDLYYGGPTQYYVYVDGTYQHTITDEEIDVTYKNELSIQSDKLATTLIDSSDKENLDFINNSTISALCLSNEARAAVALTYTYTYVPSYTYLSARSNYCGYRDGGVCGYIAANLVLYYWERRKTDNSIVQSTWLRFDRNGLNSSYLTTHLCDTIGPALGIGYGTSGWDIRDVLIEYCNRKGIYATSAYYLGAVCAAGEIAAGRPVILFGSFFDVNTGSGYVTHAVTAYGYRTYSGGNEYIVHYGWNGYANIILNALLYGSMTTFRLL